jgi:hypothetical protein
VCPECGASVAGSLQSPHADHVVADDRPCLKCGYSLRGLASSGVCPECGTEVARSLQGNLLRYSDRAYLLVLHRGAIIAEVAIAATIIIAVVQIGAGAALGPTPGILAAFQLASAAASVASLVGWWMVTSPDPAFVGRDTGASSRKVLRVTLAISAGFLLVRQVMFAAALWTTAGGSFSLLGGVALISGLAWIVSYFATMLYVRWLGRRVPDEKLVRRVRLLLWLGPVVVVGSRRHAGKRGDGSTRGAAVAAAHGGFRDRGAGVGAFIRRHGGQASRDVGRRACSGRGGGGQGGTRDGRMMDRRG